MSTYESSMTPVVVDLQTENQSFLIDGVDLKKLQREVRKQSKSAIDALVSLLEESKDENIKFRAASKLLDLEVEIAKTISQDSMQRLIAEIKLVRGPKKLIDLGDDKSRPLVDFTNIRSID